MTREEVIANVEAKIKRIKHIMDEGDYGCVDIENWERWEKQLEYQEIILAALRVPVPDPDTGLVPCGCGGKAKIWPSDLRQATDYEVGCTECAMTTGWVRGKQENAMNVWNTAMGWKGGAE